MLYILVLLFIAYGIEPAIQFVLFEKTESRRKGKGKKEILFCWCICYLMIVIKQILALNDNSFELVLCIVAIVFYVLSCYWIFECSISKIIICAGLLLILAMLSECITFVCFTVFGYGISKINMISPMGVIVTYSSKAIYFVLCIAFFKIRKKGLMEVLIEMTEILPVLIAVIAFEIPTVVIFNNMDLITYNDVALLFFATSQIIMVLLVSYFLAVVRKHRLKEKAYEIRIQKDSARYQNYKEMNMMVEELRELKHDFRSHINVLQKLYSENCIEELGEYIYQLADAIKPVENFISLENKSVEGLLNQKVKVMKEKNIEFEHIIEISDFVMIDKDICSLLGNILDNAIEASEQADKKYVQLRIHYENTGYRIMCSNTYSTEPIIKKGKFITIKDDKEHHGLGIKIVRKIAEKYHGMLRINVENKQFNVNIFIPYGGEAYENTNM